MKEKLKDQTGGPSGASACSAAMDRGEQVDKGQDAPKSRGVQPAQCRRCDGCGQIANDDDGTPWTYWANLPVGSALAVVAGFVRPIPCPDCNGDSK